MPWTPAQAKEHKKDLTPAQAKRWAAVANRARAKCLENGRSEAECDAEAIRIANGAIGAHGAITEAQACDYKVHLAGGYTPKVEMFRGRRHLVVPVIMMVEGVHHGSAGPLFHSAEELGKFPGAFNGIPVSIAHPCEDGYFISCNTPDILEKQGVGTVFNTRMDGNALKGEAWFDEAQLCAVSPEVHQMIMRGEALEVSLGIFTDDEKVEGEWNGEVFEAIAHNHRPDHLAVLIGVAGACSLSDGCGIRAHMREGGEEMEISDSALAMMKRMSALLAVNAAGYREIIHTLENELNKMDTQTQVHFLREVYSDSFVYEVQQVQREGENAIALGGTVGLFQRSYEINKGTVTIVGTPIEVRRSVTYVKANEEQINDERGETEMTVKCKGCKEVVDRLIANEVTVWQESDRETLMSLGEEMGIDHLKKYVPVEVNTVPVEKTDTEAITQLRANNEVLSAELKALKEKISDPEQFVRFLPKAHREQFEHGLALFNEQRALLIANILSAQGEEAIYSEEELKAMDFSALQKLAKVVGSPVDYSLNAGGGNLHANTEADEPPMAIGGISFEQPAA